MMPKSLPVAAVASALVLAIAPRVASVHGFVPSTSTSTRSSSSARSPTSLFAQRQSSSDEIISTATTTSNQSINVVSSRKRFLLTSTSAALLPSILASFPAPSSALVKGNAPPPKKKSSSDGGDGGGAPKCRNVEECQEQAERAEEARMREEAERAASGPKAQVTSGGTRYLDVDQQAAGGGGAGDNNGAAVAKAGDDVEIHYKVLKLGKRSYDGLSGEGTVVFSRGYALEDDEKVPGDRSFKFKLGDGRVIKGLNDAVPGMATGGTRRISVTPRNGWEKDTRECDGGPGGRGAGGELKTDYVVVPTATMVEQEACFDRTKLPFPTTYAQERRMAQRFDQSLIVEVRLVKIS